MTEQKPNVVDAHAHWGRLDRSMPQTMEDYLQYVAGSDIGGVAVFPPVLEIYDRYDPFFTDTPSWRQRRRDSNAHLLELDPPGLVVYPYFFIWNDFAVSQLTQAHCGIKWHRHDNEPVYRYDDPVCLAALAEIRRRNLPVVLEETFENTLRFVFELAAGITVIIPHLGFLNGGFEAIVEAGLWSLDHVWADTALASRQEIRRYIAQYGHERLMYGSDFPFGDPVHELDKVRSLDLSPETFTAVLGGNFHRLQSDIVRL